MMRDVHLTNFVTLILLVTGLISAVTGCARADGAKLNVVATTNIVADTVRRVVGDAAEVTSLMGPGVDPHLYNATQGDLRTLSRADVIFYNGLNLEGKMGTILAQMGRRTPTFALTDYMAPDQLLIDPEWGTADPHTWFDLLLWIRAVERVRDAMSQVDPSNAPVYSENAERYIEELSALHAEVEAKVATIPPGSRVLVTAHDAFSYLGRRYGLEVVALQGLSTDTEFGLADVRSLVNLLVERDVRAVFLETSVSTHGIQAVIEGARAQGHNVQIGGELYSDALGAEGTPTGTLVGMVRHNIDTIVSALTD